MPLQVFGGLDHILLKRYYRTISIWSVKLAAKNPNSSSIEATPIHTRQSIADIPITPRERQPDPEIVIKHEDLYARAWECEYDETLSDSEYNNLTTPSPPEITIRSQQAGDEKRSTPGTIPGNSPEIIPQPDRPYYGTDTDHDIQPDADTSV